MNAALIRNWVKENARRIRGVWEFLHERAEVSWKETATTAFLAGELKKLGLKVQTFEDITGVIGVWEGSPTGPTVGLRADIDALWQQVDGEWKANHSCGHDAHMTMVLFAVSCLKELGWRPPGRLKVLFQPAEETGQGALAFIRKGVVDDVDLLLGIHLRPVQEVPFGKASPAIYHGATTHLTGTVRGVQAHAARPHLGVNAVDALAAVIQAVNSVRMNPVVPWSAKVTKVSAGGANLNIIPDEAEFGLDLRAQTNEAMDDLIARVTRAVTSASRINGAEAEVREVARMAAAVPHAGMERVVTDVIKEILGEDALFPVPVSPGGEDFHFYAARMPRLASTMIGLGAGLSPGLHHPNMSFDLKALEHGTMLLAMSAVRLFEREAELVR
ncbi:M20 peptidase aminoacylase family protein [Staphylospora marina]|uniref:M20 peptidase aminoacylase family protein n=1 Tax=Staphylospora marina TaxID=2490858 RepID=UPI001F14BC36|nr:M20 peptidase aminoacylase family protein [Staphylospora marina]